MRTLGPDRMFGLIVTIVMSVIMLVAPSDGRDFDVEHAPGAPGGPPNPLGPPCIHLPCVGVSAGPFGNPPSTFVPDRRPALRLNLFGAQYENGPTGQPLWWLDETDDGVVEIGAGRYDEAFDGNGIPDSVDELLDRLDQATAQGWRRVVLKMPAGQFPASEVPSSQWWTMPQWKRDAITEHVSAWIDAHPDTELSVYVGLALGNPCSLHTVNTFYPDTTNPDHMCLVYQNVKPWQDVGIATMWLDGAGAQPDRVSAIDDLNESPNYRGSLRFGGEPLPTVRLGSSTWVPDADALQRGAFVVTQSYLETHPRGFGGNTMWTLDPQTTEVAVAFAPSSAEHASADIHVVKSYVDHGFVAWAFDELSAEYVRRIHGLGSFECPADLDAGGTVDLADLTQMLQHWGATGVTVYHGDVTGDGAVTFVDLLALLRSWGSCD